MENLQNAVSLIFLASIVFNLVMTLGFYLLHKRNKKVQKQYVTVQKGSFSSVEVKERPLQTKGA